MPKKIITVDQLDMFLPKLGTVIGINTVELEEAAIRRTWDMVIELLTNRTVTTSHLAEYFFRFGYLVGKHEK